ncbi:MAG: AraD1 family protein [Candidatus Korobacteraceae bacterium]
MESLEVPLRLIQVRNRAGARRVGMVDEPRIQLLEGCSSIYELAQQALAAEETLPTTAAKHRSTHVLSYDEIYDGRSEWKILPAIDHPEPSRCLVSGTGLTHRKSAQNRQAMHAADAAPTDSMRIYQWGVEGGRPAPGEIGVAPEWFYKGCGTILRAHGESLTVPPHAEDGGEEPEVAGVYVIDAAGVPRRIGMTTGNEFSDHKFEKKNYLYLAFSKLMVCSIGPELVVDADFTVVTGEVRIERAGQVLWSRQLSTGEAAMSHSLANLEHHHFKHPAHRRPGDVHVHFVGTDGFSFGENVILQDADVMEVSFAGFGRPLRNPVAVDREAKKLFAAVPL